MCILLSVDSGVTVKDKNEKGEGGEWGGAR